MVKIKEIKHSNEEISSDDQSQDNQLSEEGEMEFEEAGAASSDESGEYEMMPNLSDLGSEEGEVDM